MTTETQTETVAALTAQVAEMAKHLRHQGLIPAEVRTKKVLSDAERRELQAAEAASEKTWRAETDRIQSGLDEAQRRYDEAGARMRAANDELRELRVQLVRATERHVEKRDAIRKELA